MTHLHWLGVALFYVAVAYWFWTLLRYKGDLARRNGWPLAMSVCWPLTVIIVLALSLGGAVQLLLGLKRARRAGVRQ